MKARAEGDYGDFIIHEKETVQQFVIGAKDYIDYVEQLINKIMNGN